MLLISKDQFQAHLIFQNNSSDSLIFFNSMFLKLIHTLLMLLKECRCGTLRSLGTLHTINENL